MELKRRNEEGRVNYLFAKYTVGDITFVLMNVG